LLAPPAGVVLQPPVPASMARRAGRHHAQMLIESPSRSRLQGFLDEWVPHLGGLPAKRSLRWALDVDPLDIF
jgi:primosomal protein N' (replication factor Y)